MQTEEDIFDLPIQEFWSFFASHEKPAFLFRKSQSQKDHVVLMIWNGIQPEKYEEWIFHPLKEKTAAILKRESLLTQDYLWIVPKQKCVMKYYTYYSTTIRQKARLPID